MFATFLAAFGLLLTGVGLLYAARQLRISRKIARGEFLLHLYELVQQFNDVHAALIGSGKWVSGKEGPQSDEEWARVNRYMGLLESLQLLIEDGFLDIRTVDRLYSHRVVALMGSEVIRQRNLVDQADHWRDFTALLRSLENQDCYRAGVNEGGGRLASSERLGIPEEH